MNISTKLRNNSTGELVTGIKWTGTNFTALWVECHGQIMQSKVRGALIIKSDGNTWPIEIGEWLIIHGSGALAVHSDEYVKNCFSVDYLSVMGADAPPTKHQ